MILLRCRCCGWGCGSETPSGARLLSLSMTVLSRGGGTSDDVKSSIFSLDNTCPGKPCAPRSCHRPCNTFRCWIPPDQQEGCVRTEGPWWTSPASLTAVSHRDQGITVSHSPQTGQMPRVLARLWAQAHLLLFIQGLVLYCVLTVRQT